MGSRCEFCIGGMNVNCVGIDVSKGKSMIAVMLLPLGEMVIPPFEVGSLMLSCVSCSDGWGSWMAKPVS